MSGAEPTRRRPPGRPQRLDEAGVPTRERLLVAATELCVEQGFEGVTVAEVARRAGVSTPGLYNHFGSRSELMVEACRRALHRLDGDDPGPLRDPVATARRYLSPDFADARVLQLELHLASLRHDDVRDLLAKWHGDMAARWGASVGADPATVKAWFLLLLGLAQLDALETLAAADDELTATVERLLPPLFASER